MEIAAVSAMELEALIQKEKRLLLVDFWAAWCGPCRAMLPHLERFHDLYHEQLVLVKVNVDESPDLAKHYQIKALPTLILLSSGTVLARKSGLCTLPALKLLVEDHLT